MSHESFKSMQEFQLTFFSSPPPPRSRLSLESTKRQQQYNDLDHHDGNPTFAMSSATDIVNGAQVLLSDILPLSNMNPSQTNHKLLRRALLDYHRGNLEESQNTLTKYIKLSPNHFIAHFVMGMCAFQMKQYQMSEKHFRICCLNEQVYKDQNVMDIAYSHYNRSLAFMFLKSNKTNMAMSLKSLNRSIEIYNREPLFYRNRAFILRRKGLFEAAQRDYDTIRKLSK